MLKKIIILDHNRGRLTNQLWNFVSLYACALEKNYILDNYYFFDYAQYFKLTCPKNFLVKWLFYSNLRKQKWYRHLRPYDRYLSIMTRLHKNQILESGFNQPFYLPPTPSSNQKQLQLFEKINNNSNKTFYTLGWLFRNPLGLKKYYPQIKDYFAPIDSVNQKIRAFLAPLRIKYPLVIGIHWRQTDYKTYENGQYYFSASQVKNILVDYLQSTNQSSAEVAFVICSDQLVSQNDFQGLNIFQLNGNPVEDLFLLSQTDLIIGSNSTYGPWAAYYGNIPIITFSHDRIDWSIIKPGQGFNWNNQCTLVHY